MDGNGNGTNGKNTRGNVKTDNASGADSTRKGVKTRTGRKADSTYHAVISGEKTPQGYEKGFRNLRPDLYNFGALSPERRSEISRKGAQAVHKLHGEKKTAKQALENVLTLKITDEIAQGADVDPAIIERLKRDNPNATLYDLIQAVAVGRAVGGSIPAMQYVRDTHGDKPIDRVEVTDNVTTDADRALMRTIVERLNGAERVEIVADITPDDVKSTGQTAE